MVLSLQLGFAVIPLIHFVSNRKTMGDFAIGLPVKILAWVIASIIIALNGLLVIDELINWFAKIDNPLWIILILIVLSAIFLLLLYITFMPFIRGLKEKQLQLHTQEDVDLAFSLPEYKKILVALDFSDVDREVLRHALAIGKPDSIYILTHIVESIPAIYHQHKSRDLESVKRPGSARKICRTIAQIWGYQVETKTGIRLPKKMQSRKIYRKPLPNPGYTDSPGLPGP